MNGFDYAREALVLMGYIAGGILTAAALIWCVAVLWIELEPAVRDRLDRRDAGKRKNPYTWDVETRKDWRKHSK